MSELNRGIKPKYLTNRCPKNEVSQRSLENAFERFLAEVIISPYSKEKRKKYQNTHKNKQPPASSIIIIAIII